jgi:tellurite methyltransferase
MTKPAIGVLRYSKFFRLSRACTVLDYGAGTLRNALYLANQGFSVYAADLPEQVKVLRNHPEIGRLAGLLDVRELERSHLGVDVVLSTYVFNIILPKAKRHRYLQNVTGNLRFGGYLLLEVASRHDEGNSYFNCDTCARTYTHQQLDRLLAPYRLRRICHYYSSHALAALYQLDQEQPQRDT